jgi:hypothetical protein
VTRALVKCWTVLWAPAGKRLAPMLKSQIPIRTWADWDDAVPGFVEIELVDYCRRSFSGTSVGAPRSGFEGGFALLFVSVDEFRHPAF